MKRPIYAASERRMMRRLYGQLDHAVEQWEELLEEVKRAEESFGRWRLPTRSGAGFV